MTQHRDVAVGASAGGVDALRAVVGGLSADHAGAVPVVLHEPRDAPRALPGMSSCTRLGGRAAGASRDGAIIVMESDATGV